MTQTTLDLSPARKLREFAADIKIGHSIFAMPFALLAAFMAARGVPGIVPIALVVVCMVGARTFAMAMNRLLDARLDAMNPRTARRSIPAGRLSRGYFAGALAVSGASFVAGAWGFGAAEGNWLPLVLSLPALLFVGAYPLLKRFTRLCHYYLGAALGLAPVCAWIAIAGNVGADQQYAPLILGASVMLWTAGFDVLYATADVESDRQTGVHSVPARLGVGRALWVARLTHAVAIAGLVAVGFASPLLGPIWFGAVACVVVMLAWEHSLVKPHDLSKLNLAFFTLNGVIALVLGTAGIVDVVA